MIHDELCTYEVAKLAKEKGFDWHPPMYFHSGVKCDLREVGRNGANPNNIPYSPHISCPTQTQLQRWLREERGVIVEVFVDDDSNMPLTYNIHQYKDWNWECVCHHHGNYYAINDWELCLEDALRYALENLA